MLMILWKEKHVFHYKQGTEIQRCFSYEHVLGKNNNKKKKKKKKKKNYYQIMGLVENQTRRKDICRFEFI